MNYKLVRNIVGGIVFLISAIVLFSTVQPSVSFWDCGEFIAASFSLQVPHPPGAPFFLLLGKLFSMIPFVENIALRVNTISVLSSVLSVFFAYHIIVKLVENYRGKEPKNLIDGLGTYIAAAIGALSFCFSDTFWFNAAEAEVYAMSTVLLAGIVYLIMRWHERADRPGNEKYLIFIAYLVGLSTGVHLMSILALISVVMVVMFRKYLTDDEHLKKTGYILLGHAGIVLAAALLLWNSQDGNSPPGMEAYKDFDQRFLVIMGVISAVYVLIFWKKLFSRNSIYMPLIIGGVLLFFTYPGVVKIMPGIMTGIAGDNMTQEILLIALALGIIGGIIYYAVKNKKPTLHLLAVAALFILIGFSTYSMVIIRSNMDTPMNENEPKTFSKLVSYLNREQYGDFPTFKRRFATEPHQMVVYENYSSDLDFWWRYQMNHMMTRYLLWNYAGREGWVQEDGANIAPFNKLGNFFGKIFNVRFNGVTQYSLFAIPLILGIFGIYFHFKRDWKMAAVFMVLFIFMGYLTAYYQNQQQPQPRERDYFYVGAFFVFSIWIGMAIRGFIDIAQEKVNGSGLRKAFVVVILLAGILLVPVRMVMANYHTHDRSDNWIPWDYSYNMLQSCGPDAVLFTNGDNDTFPLWYLQDVEGVRRDIRIANLSLLNTNWYIWQLKNLSPYGSKPVSMKVSNAQLDADNVRPIQWEPRTITIPVSSEVMKNYGVTDSTALTKESMSWFMTNTVSFQGVKAVRVQDLMVKDIIESNNWQRPIYFAVTCSHDSKIGLHEYLQLEGMAYKLVPSKGGIGNINTEVLEKQLFDEPEGYSKDYRPGFKFRGLNDSTLFLDENHSRMLMNYRNAFLQYAVYHLNKNDQEKCVAILDEMERKIPRDYVIIDYRYLFDIGKMYYQAGATDKYREIAEDIERVAKRMIEENPTAVTQQYNPYQMLIEIYTNLNEFDKAINLLNELLKYYPENQSILNQIQYMEEMKKAQEMMQQMKQDTTETTQ